MAKEEAEYTSDVWNYERYAALDDGVRYQVFSGRLVREPTPFTWHQLAIGQLYWELWPCIETAGGKLLLSPIDVVLDAGGPEIEVLQPDLLWVRRDRIAAVVERRRIAGPPDLVV